MGDEVSAELQKSNYLTGSTRVFARLAMNLSERTRRPLASSPGYKERSGVLKRPPALQPDPVLLALSCWSGVPHTTASKGLGMLVTLDVRPLIRFAFLDPFYESNPERALDWHCVRTAEKK